MTRRDQRSPEAKVWRRLYFTNRWKKAKADHLAREPFCRRQIHGNREVWATVVHHRKAHKGDLVLFFDPENFESVCAPCHDGPIQREERKGFDTAVDAGGWPIDPRHPGNGGNGRLSKEVMDRRMPPDLRPSIVPLTIVCGPPAGGKSSWVLARAADDDLVIDLDLIMARLSGLPLHEGGGRWLEPSLERRNQLLHGLARPGSYARAWFIVSAPDPAERATWQRRLGGDLVILAPPLDECIRRIRADPARRGHEARLIAAATDWWRANPNVRT